MVLFSASLDFPVLLKVCLDLWVRGKDCLDFPVLFEVYQGFPGHDLVSPDSPVYVEQNSECYSPLNFVMAFLPGVHPPDFSYFFL